MASFFQKFFGSAAAHPVDDVSLATLVADMHSHLLPGLDDGAETIEQSLDLLRALQSLGFRKLIMTPHIMGDFYKNTPDGIRLALNKLQSAAAVNDLGEMELECAAEYYLDEWFGRKLHAGEDLLSFGGAKKYVLFETSYINEPFNFNEVVFQLQSSGYQPVLAHPERYTYFHGRFSDLERVRENGVLLQLNLNSLAGYYSPSAKRVAEKMVDAGMVDLVGTDTHNLKHTETLRTKTLQSEYLRKVLALPLLNSSL
ncbi:MULTISPECIES: tyrosine-protein phosphatase [Hymenobacter]|uniref:protein-tyrosine-phosphatase n=1 Tax=Hymenobacter jejuensis TaxID=2502781 RepID=A0A5B8A068_9BACT|nr:MULTISPECIES: CpsB/CapC family capsule biosynthesis tyrosine phosphatase [Hymenobacter]MBC6990941.1 capsular biosynthesis protein [Hymenobacter sp. BT491]QDA60660.1 capsular biosynthesis protein [Hymenobacter jejuensis]